MKIKALDVIGFKSFVDRLYLTFPEGITTIVGPNGCGKSNVVDAMLWGIGERSAKHLRGRSMEDVIFNGTDGRKPIGMAEVSLTFSNEDGLSPKGYEEYSDITITRRLYRSGESEYLLNKVPCRLRDVTDLFLDSGIGVNGYSIVEQGRVERLINANPQDRRFLIEEAAGIAKYKERKRLALLKMEATQQNLVRIQDVVAEVKRQITTLERQVKRAEEFKAIRKEVKEIEIRFAFQDFVELSEKGESIKGYLKALQDRELDISSQAAQKEALIEGMRLRGMEEEEKLRSAQQEAFELGRKIQKIETDIEFFRREEGGLEKRENQYKEEIRETLRAWRDALKGQRRIDESQRGLKEERDRNAEELRQLEALFNEAKEKYQSLLSQSEDEKGRLIDSLTQLTSFKNRFVHLEERKEDHDKRIRSNREESEEVSKRLAQLEQTQSETAQQREMGRSTQSALLEEKIRWEEETEELKDQFLQMQKERIASEDALRQNRSRFLSLKELQENYEGYDKGVRSILLQKREEQEKWGGILGAVADIFEPEPKYEASLEAVLGQRLQYLIVEGEKEGMEAVAYLKQEALGRGSFIPKGVLERGNPDRTVQSAGPLAGVMDGEENRPIPLSRYISVKNGFSSIADFLIGDVGVVNHWEDALDWMKRDGTFGILVTLEGDVLERSGVMSGGKQVQGLSILERQREIRDLNKKVIEGEEKCKKAYEEETRLQEEISVNESRLGERRRELQEKEIELLHRERDLEGLNKELTQYHERMDVLRYEWKQLEEEAEDIVREKGEVSVRMETEEVLRLEREEKVQSLKKGVEEIGEETEHLGRRITEKKVAQASLEEKLVGMETQMLHLLENRKTLKEQILKRVRGIRESREEGVSLLEKIRQGETTLEESLSEHRLKEEALIVQKENVEDLTNQWKEVEASSRYLRQELEDVRQKIHEEEMRVSEIQLKLQHLQDSMRERYGTTLSTLMETNFKDFPKEEMSKRLAELKKSLEGFGEVNLMALEEYQELKQRHDFLTEQQSDLHQALDSLKKAIIKINRTTTKRFIETFHLVNEKFKEVFLRLFRGGQASLVLLDEQDPSTTGIDILAQPPGKKLQNIDLLSGGEKALVATALLFGLFMIKPTPFCLLDEVDAPLDDANINRFIDLVKEFSKTSQFIFITHNKKTMETANTLYGITMETPGVSKVVSVRLNQALG
jgi:chromosome segregation protein